MTTVLFHGLRGAFRLRTAVVLATPGFRAELARDHIPEGLVTEVAPQDVRGKQDPASLLGALAARELTAAAPADDTDPFTRGVFVSTRRGNQRSVKAFAGALAAGRRSPSTFSVAGYNIVAQSTARELAARGPSVVLAGQRATLDGALFLAALRLGSGAIGTGYVGHVTWLPDPGLRGGEGLAVLAAVDHVDSAVSVSEQHVVALAPADLYGPRGPHGQAGAPAAEDFAAAHRVAPLLADSRTVAAR
ncbi:hypothetical protein MTQ10_18600 [Streptomyces sp. XM83C]|jgi:hypothetical protein|uniref:Beta-ketoacyl synthase N-terminal domain-containing protein n=1 Tax=Streptomyces thermocoprophilus TaxID=78356 RepID=A0ABV5VG42_9ACTN|nr:hypothetical protein [Streptomyces sp. XM83C]MCK1821568.1 hypothetical protein [Streptomyces sp. XM83C]